MRKSMLTVGGVAVICSFLISGCTEQSSDDRAENRSYHSYEIQKAHSDAAREVFGDQLGQAFID